MAKRRKSNNGTGSPAVMLDAPYKEPKPSMHVTGPAARRLTTMPVGSKVRTHATGTITGTQVYTDHRGRKQHSATVEFDKVRHQTRGMKQAKLASLRAGQSDMDQNSG